ncbi:hypothetical protein Sipo8835_23145 [Streptomyces ipomoeae]|uniref:Nephrocystin 3-like N-terminal domain-containing protein n=1 Tax=Streptomyces ipomoeae TaxID=103232 RepID=A0AAE8W1A7_9ACTN|nr:WD40 repeat domain-containing protein [Streptomyces ipomoeae]TQE30524.1 hypothetical protein Sipo8835_23145 [Streptomyces ipomoeae]
MARDTEGRRPLQYFPVDISRYRHHAPLNAQAEVEGVAEILAPFGAKIDAWNIDGDDYRGADAVERRLRAWADPQTRGDTFLYWVGHGASDGQSALLAHALSPRPLTDGGLTPEAIVQYLTARQAHRHARGSWAIVVIDACRSARFVQLLSAKAHADPAGGPRNVLLVSTSEEGVANLGRFRKALSTALTVNFSAENTIDLWALGRELSRNLHGCPVIPHSIDADAALHRTVPAVASALTTPLDLLAEIETVLSTFTEDERRHFVPKASGAELGEQSWYFEGRSDERHQMLTWLKTAHSGLLVVTGPAGSGKSALLGHVLIHTRPELSRLLERAGHLTPLPANTPRPRKSFDAVLHLTGATLSDLVSRMASAAALGTPPSDPSLTVQSNWLYERMRRRRKPFTLLADALDEAQLPLQTANHILRRLAELPHVRVIVGTRRSTKEGPDLPQPDDQNLLDALGVDDSSAVVVNVGRDQEAVTRYVRNRLTNAAHRLGFLGALDNADRFARDIGSLDREFLYARLAVHEIIQNHALFGDLRGLDSLLSSDHRQLFARAVDRLTALSPVNRPLLEALALAQGHGFPLRDGIWAAAATAVSDGLTITDADIEALTRTAAPYLMLDTELGQSVYRLAHRTFAEHFASAHPYDSWHHLVTARLASDANDLLPSAPPNRYLVQYLPAHAALGGSDAWQELARHSRLLDRFDPAAVTANVMRQGFGRKLPSAIAGVVASQHQLATAPPHDRRGIRELATTRYTDQFAPAGQGPAGDDPVPVWSVRWAHMRQHSLHLTLSGHTGPVRAVTSFTGPDGHTLLASSSDDDTVRIWDPATGAQLAAGTCYGRPTSEIAAFTGPNGHVVLATADDQSVLVQDLDGRVTQFFISLSRAHALVAFTRPDGHGLIAASYDDGTVRILDGILREVAVLTGQSDSVRAMAAFTGPDGHDLLAIVASDGHTMWVWDPATGTLTDHSSRALAAAGTTGPGSRTLLAVAGHHDSALMVHIWDPATGALVASLTGRADLVGAAVGFTGPDGRTLLATTADGDGDPSEVRVWDAGTGAQTANLTGHSGPVYAVTGFTGPDGRTLLATGGYDTTVRVWDPAVGAQTSDLASYEVRAVAGFTAPGGQTLLATATASGEDDASTVRVWDPASGAQTASLVDYTGAVRAMAVFTGPDGQTLLAAGGNDNTVQVRDPATGTQMTVLTGHTGEVLKVSAFTGPNGQTFLATGGYDTTVRVWDPSTGTQIAALPGHFGAVHEVAEFTGPDGQTLLATASNLDMTVRVWAPATGALIYALTIRTGRPRTVAGFAGPKGHTLLATTSAEDDATVVRIWDPATGTQTATLTGHTGGVHAVTGFTDPGGRTFLATAGGDGTVRIWDPAADFSLLVVPLGVAVYDIAPIGTDLALATAEGVVLISLNSSAWEPHRQAGHQGNGVWTPQPGSRRQLTDRLLGRRIGAMLMRWRSRHRMSEGRPSRAPDSRR